MAGDLADAVGAGWLLDMAWTAAHVGESRNASGKPKRTCLVLVAMTAATRAPLQLPLRYQLRAGSAGVGQAAYRSGVGGLLVVSRRASHDDRPKVDRDDRYPSATSL